MIRLSKTCEEDGGPPRSTYWKKWAAKHENVEMKEGVWLEPASALLRKKAKERWTDKHRNTTRKMLLEGGWVQQRLFNHYLIFLNIELFQEQAAQHSLRLSLHHHVP